MVEKQVQDFKKHEEGLLVEIENLRGKVKEAERKRKDEEELREQLEKMEKF